MSNFATIDFWENDLSGPMPKCHDGYVPDAYAMVSKFILILQMNEELFGIPDEKKNIK